jgi:hypothetical protein
MMADAKSQKAMASMMRIANLHESKGGLMQRNGESDSPTQREDANASKRIS